MLVASLLCVFWKPLEIIRMKQSEDLWVKKQLYGGTYISYHIQTITRCHK